MANSLRLLLLALLHLSLACASPSERPAPEPDVSGSPPISLPHFRWSADATRMELVVPGEGGPWLHLVRLTAGLGSNDIGLDRGQLGTSALIEFRQVGERLLLVAPNLDWRTSSQEPAQLRGVREAFAESVLFGFDIADREPDGSVVVDATAFLVRDVHGIAGKLGRGGFKLDASRSAVLPDSPVLFPSNADVEVLLTFTGDSPGGEVRATAAVAEAVTLRLRHAFVRLGGETSRCDYSPRAYHPESGFFPHTWRDMATPLGEDVVQRVLTRHHLCAVHPIIYYIDRAAPEPMRTALLEGANYWAPVFTAAGFPGGFRAELMPEGMDPHDTRYNVVQWVNRRARGWSYGGTVTDPRDGRILKGHVTLGALRVRQDLLLMEGLLAPYGQPDKSAAAIAVALDRLRQLAAHEVGHTLGLAHNFASSTSERASVMDYPAPRVRLTAAGELETSAAYAPGCGAWDLFAIRYGYGRFADEGSALPQLIEVAHVDGLAYLSDNDARGAGQSHPAANLWDDGADALVTFDEVVAVRRHALARFSESVIRPGRPLFELEAALVPLYLHHRYQLEAVARVIGGRTYTYARRGEGKSRVEIVDADRQHAALERVLSTLTTKFLALPIRLAERLVPPPPGFRRNRESFQPGARLFDPIIAAEASATLTLELLLHPQRIARLIDQQSALDPFPGAEELFLALYTSVFPAPEDQDPAAAQIALAIQTLAIDRLASLAMDESHPARVRQAADTALRNWNWRLTTKDDAPSAARWLATRIDSFLTGKDEPPTPNTPRIPPGSPIGCW